MGKRALITAIILIAGGLLLLIYRDPQFGFIFKLTAPRSATSGGSFFTPGGSFSTASPGASSLNVTLAYSAVQIIESLLGAGLVGIGVVLVGVGMIGGTVRRGQGTD